MRLAGTELSGVTNASGKTTVSRVPQGKRNVTVSKPNFDDLVFEVNFQRGHSITRTIQMTPQFEIPLVTATKEKVKVK